jgi:outer membrane protein assembly factor BamB
MIPPEHIQRTIPQTGALLLACFTLTAALAKETAPDWPAWRGPTANGHAAPDQQVPLTWDQSTHVLWKTPIPGRGHGSPTVLGDKIFVATADTEQEEQSVLCLSRLNGKPLWSTVVHKGNLDSGKHRLSAPATATVATDGERLYINFPNSRAIFTSALDLNGKLLWQKRICNFVMHQGFGVSPVVHEDAVLVNADNKGGGKVAALDRKTGELLWSHDRPPLPNYTTPAIVRAAGKLQMILSGCNLVSSFDPVSGKKLWEIAGSTEECVTAAVTDGERVFVSGGYPRNHLAAIAADGSGRIAWQNQTRVYVPSMLLREGHLYAALDSGHIACFRADSGEELWKEKVDRDFYASPVLLKNRIFITNLQASTSIVEVSPSGCKVLSQNKLGDESLSSPSICGNRIYLRFATTSPARQEYIAAVGE